MQLQWIFSVYFNKIDNSKRSEVYLVAESEQVQKVLIFFSDNIIFQEMLEWVSAICRACNLEKQDETLDRVKEKDPPSKGKKILLFSNFNFN